MFHRTLTSPPTLWLVVLATALPVLILSAPATSQSGAVDWSQWRGAMRTGEAPGERWPDDLGQLENLWQVELGKSYSGPLVTENAVFVTESIGNAKEVVRALDRTTGDELWSVEWAAKGKVPFFAAKNGEWIRSTPAYADGALYVGGIEEKLVKLDAATGAVLWTVDFPARFGTTKPDFGFVCSPLIAGGAVYLQAADGLVKLDAETGETIYRTLIHDTTIMNRGAFSSPILAELAGVPQLIVQTRTTLYGVEPESGAPLWQQDVPAFRGMNILTPLVVGDSIFTSTYRNRSFLYAVSRNAEGQFEVTERWSGKAQGYMSSPVLVDGTIYLHLGNGRLMCLDPTDGTECWRSSPEGDYWSIATRDDRLLALTETGELLLVEADRNSFKLLDRQQVADASTWAHIAVRGNEIFVRSLEGVSAHRLPTRPSIGGSLPTGAGQ